MTTLYYFEDLFVRKGDYYYFVIIPANKEYYVVVDIERDLSEMIAKEMKLDDEEFHLVAILLAYIKLSRKNSSMKQADEMPSNTLLFSSITTWMEAYDISQLIHAFKDIKWCELKEILYSGNPSETIKQIF